MNWEKVWLTLHLHSARRRAVITFDRGAVRSDIYDSDHASNDHLFRVNQFPCYLMEGIARVYLTAGGTNEAQSS